ncbi:MAG: LOG family protein [Acidobacteriota bacterium]|nr:LOG family protein [Acidobacteriota bacterium]
MVANSQMGRVSGATSERIVTIFGGSRCSEDCEEYRQARRVGQMLAESGFTICTGGYLGVMEAASRGARERGGRVLGIVMNQFKSEPNRYLTDKVATSHFYERLQNLITRSVGFVVLRGGMGTVTELSLVWNKVQTGVIGPRPLVLLGDCWPPVVEAWRKNLVVSAEDVALLDFAGTPEDAVRLIINKSKGVKL